jgi:flagellar motor switch protein FliN/FliY
MADEQPPVADSSSTPQSEADAAPAASSPDQSAELDQLAAALADPPTNAQAAPAAALAAGDLTDQAAIDELLKQANFEDATIPAPSAGASGAPASDTVPFALQNFQQVMQDAQVSSIELLRDVDLSVKIELGRSRMLVEDVLKLAEGSVVELDKFAGDPVDVFVNDRLVARGEVLVLNDNFCVRVNEIVAGVKEEGL